MSERFESQQKQVERWLLKNNSITPIDALNMFGAFRLSAIIFNLREKGMPIETEMIYNGKKRYAKYKLKSKNHERSI